MRILWLLVVCGLLAVAGCAKSSTEIGYMKHGKGCKVACEWCWNLSSICLEAQDWDVDKTDDEERGEPGVGIELIKPKRKRLLQP